ncbi:MAG: hypothetical protein K2W95_01600 [Candidatus Obscuribacterales bacterium]|nr:hypothetical protein [Candidatus Obscuribacterales bacterium]
MRHSHKRAALRRTAGGASLVELVITVLVMSFVSTAIFGMLVATMGQSKKLNNKCDAVDMARHALEKIGRDVRMGRTLGDCYGTYDATIGAVVGTNIFPSPGGQNPVYNNGAAPSGGWPSGSQTNSFGAPPYTIGNQTLVVQVPIFDNNTASANYGFPGVTIFNGTTIENVETHIYRCYLDPDQAGHPNEYVLDWMKVPGVNNSSNQLPARVGPMRICSGIVGPRPTANPNGAPIVFQYLYALDPGGTPRNGFEEPVGTPRTTWGALFNGVVVNLEIKQHNDTSANPQSSGNFKQQQVLALKSEFFLRNNTSATAAGVPQTVAP